MQPGTRPIPARRPASGMLPLLVPLVAAGTAAAAVAALRLPGAGLSLRDGIHLAVLLVAAAALTALPIDVDEPALGGASLASVAVVATAVLLGWEAATLVAAGSQVAVDALRRRRPAAVALGGAVHALAAAAAGGAAALVVALADGAGSGGAGGGAASGPARGHGLGLLVGEAAAAALTFTVVDVALVALALARSSRQRLAGLVVQAVRSTGGVAAIMASLAAVLVLLWAREPLAALLLAGPLAALALHQRSAAAAHRANRLALTDPLTGLGNNRAFRLAVTRELAAARARSRPVALALLDVDDFKEINDGHGHPQGDRVLEFVAQQLRRDGEAFRIGGDEFALVLPQRDGRSAAAVARSVGHRIRSTPSPIGEVVHVSIGVAGFPAEAADFDGLLQAADRALYAEKARSTRLAHAALPDTSELPALGRLRGGRDREARLRAAASLAHAVDARDSSTGRHSWMVGELAARISQALGLSGEMVELSRVAGRLHDLGKLAIPEEILRKPDALTDEERRVIERHAEIGFRILDALDVEPVANWVLHHHERWDGGGYPDGLAGETIPLGARILFVADSFDAMTSDRSYRAGFARERAVQELRQLAGTQFDPGIVARFLAAVNWDEIDSLQLVRDAVRQP